MNFARADEIHVCLIFSAVFGTESCERYCMSLDLPAKMIKRIVVDGRYRGWTIGLDVESTGPRRKG